ncbi:polymer-forming cytoskeletal protein [Methylocystis heyeri]|uniref:Polymer-forming cytoskeletal protein n=1 Tax=Methylocystis heyeri TaxID=391905 RepID=A0A6B8KJ68_9HYPH|nr:polymer-forming cytoskeletal protein [Methylocystis heyeri]QGM46608.1 polymer-forming cytoskeletal protein [Methylocystis heyeri]
MSDFRPEEKNAVYIGEGVRVTGVISAEDTVVVDGIVEGEIACERLVIGPTGVVQGTVAVTDADIHGKVGSEITVKQLLVVRATGRVEGKWGYGEIEVEKGGVLSGQGESTGLLFEEEEQSVSRVSVVNARAEEEDEVEAANLRVASVASRTLRERRKLV